MAAVPDDRGALRRGVARTRRFSAADYVDPTVRRDLSRDVLGKHALEQRELGARDQRLRLCVTTRVGTLTLTVSR